MGFPSTPWILTLEVFKCRKQTQSWMAEILHHPRCHPNIEIMGVARGSIKGATMQYMAGGAGFQPSTVSLDITHHWSTHHVVIGPQAWQETGIHLDITKTKADFLQLLLHQGLPHDQWRLTSLHHQYIHKRRDSKVLRNRGKQLLACSC